MRSIPTLVFGILVGAMSAGASNPGVGKGEEPPSFIELTAKSDLVVAARVLSGSLKRAEVQVTEVFRGTSTAGDKLEIAFREFNDTLPKEDKILFELGEIDILFLTHELDWEGRIRDPSRFKLYRGRFGKFVVPKEGQDLYFEAVRVLSSLATESDHRRLYERIRQLLRNDNSLLVDLGLREVGRLDLMERGLIPIVLPFLQDVSPARRTRALGLLEQYFRRLTADEKPQDLRDEGLPPIVTLARNDPEVDVRVAAVDALGAWGGPETVETLNEIAQLDSSQSVRYRAKLILLRQHENSSSGREAAPPSP